MRSRFFLRSNLFFLTKGKWAHKKGPIKQKGPKNIIIDNIIPLIKFIEEKICEIIYIKKILLEHKNKLKLFTLAQEISSWSHMFLYLWNILLIIPPQTPPFLNWQVFQLDLSKTYEFTSGPTLTYESWKLGSGASNKYEYIQDM